MSRADRIRKPTVLLEWRSSGHRLAYASAILDSAVSQGEEIHLWTTVAVQGTQEWLVHITDATQARLRVHRWNFTIGARLVWSASRTRRVIVPEADRILALLLVLSYMPWIRRTKIAPIIMRPPTNSPGIAQRLKVWSIRTARKRRNIDLLLLESPIAQRGSGVWSGVEHSTDDLLLDPADLITGVPREPVELSTIELGAQILSVVGVIDSRKRIDLVLRAWPRIAEQHPTAHLAILGKATKDLAEKIEAADVPNLLFVNRYLTQAELLATLNRSYGVFALYDGGLSSGVVLAASARSCWVFVARSGVLADASKHIGTGVPVEMEEGALADAASEKLRRNVRPPPVHLSGRHEFGLRALGLHAI